MPITDIISSFFSFYSRYNAKQIEQHVESDKPLEYLLTKGDCGVMAAAVGWVYSKKGGTDLEYCTAVHHAFIKVGNLYYDAHHPDGTEDVNSIQDVANNGFSVVSLADIVKAYMPVDNLGLSWCNAFALEHDVRVFPYLPESQRRITADNIKSTLLCHGFKEKVQSDGKTDLNPYVYNAIFELLSQYDYENYTDSQILADSK